MNRRELLAAVAAIGMIPAARAHAAAGDLKSAAREAWLYGLPLIEMAAARARMLAGGRGAQPAAINSFRHTRELATDKSRAITAPNNDTLYSAAWLDLTKGPVTLTVPPTGARYISIAGMNMYTDNDFVLGTRTSGGAGGRFTVVGPGQPGSGPNVVRLATAHGWMLARILVDGPSDLPAVHKIQDALTLSGPAGATPPAYATRMAPAGAFFASVAELLKSDPPPGTDGALFARVAPLGLTAQGGFDAKRFDAAAMAQIEAGVAEARKVIQGLRPGGVVQGWSYPRNTLGYFNQDYPFRAAVSLAGLAALPPAEAMYMQPVGDQGRMLTGQGPYRLHFDADKLPAVDAFWSLTMYEATPDGQFFLVPNPIDRYSIGDRTPGLTKNADGSLDIWIARADPGGDKSANWLPAPAQGPFSLSFRAYLPNERFRDGTYRLPALQTV
ncbi:MAG: DUF1254 domain-containing protein [Alphaproteobacteria bacterium]|nr:DUF1254 domain-containing protein [Alphaproteobacteria bacterium]MBU1513228.1 DUF1254 domain-containing protein [Alphaproteobacteria bacterium]MBU2095336.1 DUF1254 domain-containing protein [Alphaproteobacteria bacterium]MBU2152251.1 DUF1254 domain-containing protein [Alphaproteobacteria bacterium]MBU2306702.1 DUF1254 domain-containing protein [Alphaproteobacteria bacterium]